MLVQVLNDVLLILQNVYSALRQGEVSGDSEQRLQAVVTLSLQGLPHACTSMFLDAATLLQGWSVAKALAVWQAWRGPNASSYFEDLCHSSLVEVQHKKITGDVLAMHDVLVALGQGIVLHRVKGFEEHYGSRVWIEGAEHHGYQEVR
jgi:hypothetical protein